MLQSNAESVSAYLCKFRQCSHQSLERFALSLWVYQKYFKNMLLRPFVDKVCWARANICIIFHHAHLEITATPKRAYHSAVLCFNAHSLVRAFNGCSLYILVYSLNGLVYMFSFINFIYTTYI